MARSVGLVLLGLLPAVARAADRKPNLVFILADDLGWRDTSVYGSKYHEPPNIDRLAKRGMRFNNANAANPLCSPTRASILTGWYTGTWVRKGDWKLIRFHHDGDGQADRFELFDMKDDLSETKNLAAAMPDKVWELNALIELHLEDTGVLVSVKNPRYDPKAKPPAEKKEGP